MSFRSRALHVIDTKGHPVRRMLKDAALAFSVANLCLITGWFKTVYDEDMLFLSPNLPRWQDYAALLCDTLLLSGAFFLAVTLLRNWKEGRFLPWARGAFFLFALVALNELRIQFLGPVIWDLRALFGMTVFLSVAAITGCLVVWALVRWFKHFVRLARFAVAILVPFGCMNLALASWSLLQEGIGIIYNQSPAPPAAHKHPASRIVWIVFDELDYRAAFGERLPSVSMPEMDRLRRESLFATHAYPPAGDTLYSLPSLISGRTAKRVKRKPSDLVITYAGHNVSERWSVQPNIFSHARSFGARTALVGWHIPYGRIIDDDLDKCVWFSSRSALEGFTLSFGQAVRFYFRLAAMRFFGHVPVVRMVLHDPAPPPPESWAAMNSRAWQQIQKEALATAANPDYSLVLIHHCVPHLPGIYDRRKKEFTMTDVTYFDNLELMDRTFGELRRSLEQAGLWEQTTILVSSDHWFRTYFWRPHCSAAEFDYFSKHLDRRIPFILKLAGISNGVVYSTRFDTVITHDLLLAILCGDVKNMQELVSWMGRHTVMPRNEYEDHSNEDVF